MGNSESKFPKKPASAAGNHGNPAITPNGTAIQTSSTGIAAPTNTLI